MERYLGIDAHARSCTICVMNQAGKRVRQDVVDHPQWKPGNKSDAIDAWGLANRLRTGQIETEVCKADRCPPVTPVDVDHGPFDGPGTVTVDAVTRTHAARQLLGIQVRQLTGPFALVANNGWLGLEHVQPAQAVAAQNARHGRARSLCALSDVPGG